jgi:hypothetical protein
MPDGAEDGIDHASVRGDGEVRVVRIVVEDLRAEGVSRERGAKRKSTNRVELKADSSVKVFVRFALSWRPEFVCIGNRVSPWQQRESRGRTERKAYLFRQSPFQVECRVGRGEIALRSSSIAYALEVSDLVSGAERKKGGR